MNPEALFEDLSRFVADSRQLLSEGTMMDMSGFDARVQQLCDQVMKLTQEERLRHAEKLQQLLGDLQQLGETLVAQRDQLKEELQNISEHKKANTAYRTVEASDKKNQE